SPDHIPHPLTLHLLCAGQAESAAASCDYYASAVVSAHIGHTPFLESVLVLIPKGCSLRTPSSQRFFRPGCPRPISHPGMQQKHHAKCEDVPDEATSPPLD